MGDARELEELWKGEFGNAYVGRNAAPVEARTPFWRGVVERYAPRRMLEVGCAHGENLRHLSSFLPAEKLWGADINQQALTTLRSTVPGVNAVWSPARHLPFRDGYFDFVYTMALLIHQPDDTLPLVMNEIVRCSSRWILCGEYAAEERTDVNYRGLDGILIKRDYGRLYPQLFPGLELREEGYLTREEGFDRVTYQVFERVS